MYVDMKFIFKSFFWFIYFYNECLKKECSKLKLNVAINNLGLWWQCYLILTVPKPKLYIVETLTARQSHNTDVSYIHFELCVVQTLQLRCTDMEACSTKVG